MQHSLRMIKQASWPGWLLVSQLYYKLSYWVTSKKVVLEGKIGSSRVTTLWSHVAFPPSSLFKLGYLLRVKSLVDKMSRKVVLDRDYNSRHIRQKESLKKSLKKSCPGRDMTF